jgi:hypothetical protein
MKTPRSRIRSALVVALPVAAAAGIALAGYSLSATASPMRAAPAAPHATPAAPVLVELYQSEGCSSCPPAEAWLNGVADRPGLVALSFEVTYWDHLGWKDRFASPEFTRRQRDYAARNASHEVYTPQFWINGQRTIVGAKGAELENAIASVRPAAPVPVVGAGDVTVAKGNAPARPAQVWLARYDPRVIRIPVKAGENTGRTLPHRNLVRELTLLGEWKGEGATYRFKPSTTGLRSAVFLQDGRGGSVLSVASDRSALR